jgi:hypothetical protein
VTVPVLWRVDKVAEARPNSPTRVVASDRPDDDLLRRCYLNTDLLLKS